MNAKIVKSPAKVLIGMHSKMSLTNNRTQELWQAFMPRRWEIGNIMPGQYYSLQVYSEMVAFKDFGPETFFEMWAAVEVEGESKPPQNMDRLLVPEGEYAIFIHKGTSKTLTKTFDKIYNHWLPTSGYQLDNRPHFQLMDESYQPGNPNSSEEVWIPVRATKN